jgi:hypothetical protein
MVAHPCKYRLTRKYATTTPATETASTSLTRLGLSLSSSTLPIDELRKQLHADGDARGHFHKRELAVKRKPERSVASDC